MLIPAMGFLFLLFICGALVAVGIFVLTYTESNWSLGRGKWSLGFFVIGALPAGLGALSAYAWVARHLSDLTSITAFVDKNVMLAAIVISFLLVVSSGAIVGGLGAVWLGDRLFPNRTES
jgi:hypothetical protein